MRGKRETISSVAILLSVLTVIQRTKGFVLGGGPNLRSAGFANNVVTNWETSQDLSTASPCELEISFSHVHLYVDCLDDLDVYKQLESSLNAYHEQSVTSDLDPYSLFNQGDSEDFVSYGRDIVKQFLVGLGLRVTAFRYPSTEHAGATRTVLVSSCDPKGVQFLISAGHDEERSVVSEEELPYFRNDRVRDFFYSHQDRQGISVLAFETNDVDRIYRNYIRKHDSLVASYRNYDESEGMAGKVLEVYAYYSENSDASSSLRQPDRGTMLRFVQQDRKEEKGDQFQCFLPGLEPVEAVFHQNSSPVYCDHWVSNVFSRTSFLKTLESTLGFGTKVDFNAGIVAAGEAQIESTVIGNNSPFSSTNAELVLRDQSQIFLPINNALSSKGHVYQFLQEYGQGIQHVASRVENLIEFVSKNNKMRKLTGEGFSFLSIPRSYYGILTADSLASKANITERLAQRVIETCRSQRVVDMDDSVRLDIESHEVSSLLAVESQGGLSSDEEYLANKERITEVILMSRYENLVDFLGDRFSSETYLGIVRNQILVDLQGEDILFQIFTSNILQRKDGDESPFLEFIQRVCSVDELDPQHSRELRAGCGGFGIRNFLTLFLSIELNKAFRELRKATEQKDDGGIVVASRYVDCLTGQMQESNPILKEIADSMAEEGKYEMLLKECEAGLDEELMLVYRKRLLEAGEKKASANRALQECSSRYNLAMKSIREGCNTDMR